MAAALLALEADGRLLFQQRRATAIERHSQLLAAHRAEDEELRRVGKVPPPRAAVAAPNPAHEGAPLDWLSCHPPRLYLELMRTFASYGEVQGCYQLLTQLYQLSLHNNGLIPWSSDSSSSSSRTSRSPRRSRPPSQKQRMEDSEREQRTAEESKRDQVQRSAFTPDGDLLAAIMTAYAVSPTAFPPTHHHQLFTHLQTLQVAASPEFHRSLLMYHAHQHSVHSYITSMSLLSRTRHPPTIEHHISALRYFGVKCRDVDAALALFLHVTALHLPNATLFNTMIAVLGEAGDWMMGYRLMTDMESQGQRASAWTYAGLMQALLVDGREKMAVDLHNWARQWKRKEVEGRKEQWMDNCYVVLMRYHREQYRNDKAVAVWKQLLDDGVEPSYSTYASAIAALQAAGHAAEACELVRQLLRRRAFPCHADTCLVALHALAEQRDYRTALQVYASTMRWLKQRHLSVPSDLYLRLLTTFPTSLQPAASATSTAGEQSTRALSSALLSLLRDHLRAGLQPATQLLQSMAQLLRAYGATSCAHKLSAFTAGDWSEEWLLQLEEELSELQQSEGGSGSDRERCAHSDGAASIDRRSAQPGHTERLSITSQPHPSGTVDSSM